jgi:peptidoglycan/LPS O-acetylase OafA/YrhL
LARLAERRGGLLVFVIPLMLVRFILQPFFPEYTGWSDFVFTLLFFVFGFIIMADERFRQAVRRDWSLHLILGIACTLFFFSVGFGAPVYDWLASPGTFGFFTSHAVFCINGWCWTLFMIYIGMRFLDVASPWLQYGRERSYAFFFFHQPVIILIAFYAVQWETGIALKLLVVLLGALLITLGLVEFIKHTKVLRGLFGMKPRLREVPSSEAG